MHSKQCSVKNLSRIIMNMMKKKQIIEGKLILLVRGEKSF